MSYSDDDEYDDYGEDESDEEYYQKLSDKVDFSLFETQGGAAQAHGELKAHKTIDGSLVYYKNDLTGYTTSVERLLQADGYADSTEKQRLTLIVLKVVLACSSRSKIKKAVLSMSFEDIPRKSKKKAKIDKKVEPVIQAWAPFDRISKTNPVNVEHENTTKGDVDLGGGAAGANAKGSTGIEIKTKWTSTYWETAHSFPTHGKDQKRTGVRWVLKANEKAAQGLDPNLTVGILLSRQSDEPYLANFDINVTGGALKQLVHGIETLLCLNPDATKPYKVTPSEDPLTLHTGVNMLKNVKLKDMLKLKGKGDSLILVWEDEHDAEKKGAKEAEKVDAEKEGPAPSVAD